MISYSPLDYLCIDIANCVGKQGNMLGDKDTFENRIAWVKENVNNLADFYDVAEDKYQYIKAVLALTDVLAGIPTGHTVALDAICSGISIMSVITGCVKGCKATGLIDTGERPDAYNKITIEMNKVLASQGITVQTPRSLAKEATMTKCYGSTNKPTEIFGDDTLELRAFEQACFTVAPEAFKLMQDLIDSWQPKNDTHAWYLPDAFAARIKVLKTVEKTLQIDELDSVSVTVHLTEHKPQKTGVANCANVIHSIDAYVLRCMQRRCSYDPHIVDMAIELLNLRIQAKTMPYEASEKLEELIAIYEECDMPDLRVIQEITEESVGIVPVKLATKLLSILKDMKHYGSFHLLTIHDAFRAHPNNCEAVRFHYKEIMADLADSNILQFIYSQIVGYKVVFNKAMQGISALIRKANYQLS